MGTRTTTEIVKNVVYVGNLTTKFQSELSLEAFESFEDEGMPIGFTHREWCVVDDCKEVGRLLVDELQKGSLTIHLVNTSSYAHVGEEDYVVFSEDPKAVKEFLKDWNIQEEIVDLDSISQTL